MKEKRIKVIIDRTGNYKIETLSGFAGNNCQKTVEEIAVAIGGNVKEEGDTSDKYREPDTFVTEDCFV